MSKRRKFHCKNDKQKKAIRRSYAIRQRQQQQNNSVPAKQSRPPFKLPLKNGGNRWNIFQVPNFILNGKQDHDVHGGLVLDEMNNKVLLVEVTHSKKRKGRNTIDIRNLCLDDLDEKGELCESHLVRRLIVSYRNQNGESAIDVSALKKQMNDLQFAEDEKKEILEQLSHLSTAEEKYNQFVELANKKD